MHLTWGGPPCPPPAENNVIGFGTYGEQFAGLHFNQTFTGVAIGSNP